MLRLTVGIIAISSATAFFLFVRPVFNCSVFSRFAEAVSRLFVFLCRVAMQHARACRIRSLFVLSGIALVYRMTLSGLPDGQTCGRKFRSECFLWMTDAGNPLVLLGTFIDELPAATATHALPETTFRDRTARCHDRKALKASHCRQPGKMHFLALLPS